MALQNTKSEFALNNFTANNSHSINKFAAKAVQKSDGKKCEQLCPIKTINGIKSINPPKYSNLSAKTQFPRYKYHRKKNNSLFDQNKFRIQSSSNNSVKSINSINPVHSINNRPKTKANKSTPTKARVTFSDTTPSTPATNTSSNTETTRSGRLIVAADDICFTETLNKIFSKKF